MLHAWRPPPRPPAQETTGPKSKPMFGKRKVVAAAIADDDNTEGTEGTEAAPPAAAASTDPGAPEEPAKAKPSTAPAKAKPATAPANAKPAKSTDAGPKPQRGQTAYFLFMADRRPKLRGMLPFS